MKFPILDHCGPCKKMYVRLTCQAGKSFRYSVTEIQALEHTPFLCGPELLKKQRFVSSSGNMAVLLFYV